jgi:hypothetical protein
MIDELITIKIVVDDELQEMFAPSEYGFSALHIQYNVVNGPLNLSFILNIVKGNDL